LATGYKGKKVALGWVYRPW